MIIALLILIPLTTSAAVTPKIPSLQEMCAQTILKHNISYEGTHIAPFIVNYAQSVAHQHNDAINELTFFNLSGSWLARENHNINALRRLPITNSSLPIARYATKIYLHRIEILQCILFSSAPFMAYIDYSTSCLAAGICCPLSTLACCCFKGPREIRELLHSKILRELFRYACCAPEYRPYLYPRAQNIDIPDAPSPDEDTEHEKYD